MSDEIFKNEAPRYWEIGLPVLPLEYATKKPAKGMSNWTGLLAAIPNAETQQKWLAKYPGCGVGLLLGKEITPGYTLGALDVDDDALVRMVLKFIGLNRQERRAVISGKRGKKGATFFVRAPLLPKFRSTTLQGANGLGNIDVLAGGRYTVMPPSRHPDTGKPYEAVGTCLLDADFEALPIFFIEHEKIIELVLKAAETPIIRSGKATHEAGVTLTAKLVAAGAQDDEVTAIFEGLLPEDYSGNSLEELPGWIYSAREKGFEPSPKQERDNAAARLVSLATGEDIDLFNDGNGTAFASVPSETGFVTYRVMSGLFRSWLRHQAYKKLAKPGGTGPLLEAIATIETIALFDGNKRDIYSRIGGNADVVEIDLGTRDGRTVRITGEGWEVSSEAMHKFIRGAGFDPHPDPVRGGSLRMFQEFLGIDDCNFYLLVAFLLNALKPTGPYFILLIEGEQGSGKSVVSQVIKTIIDPNKAARLRLPDNDRDLMIHAKEYWLLNYDNASGMKADMSDALCSLATGGGIAVRRLYTDGDLHVMSFARPFVINGIAGYANRPDLMERAIPIKLAPMTDGMRRTEAEMHEAFQQILPSILGVLYDAVACALRNFDQVEPPRNLRMADAARWILAAEPSLGVESGTIIAAIAEAQNELFIERINDDALVVRIREILVYGPFEGYVGELFARLDPSRDNALPRSPARLSAALIRLRPAMARAGIKVEFFEKDRKGRRIRISEEGGTPISGKY